MADEERNTPAFEAHIYHRSSWPPFLLSPMGKAARTVAATTRRRRLAIISGLEDSRRIEDQNRREKKKML